MLVEYVALAPPRPACGATVSVTITDATAEAVVVEVPFASLSANAAALVTDPIRLAYDPSAGIVHGGPSVFELVANARSSW
jgi:hypothetical protein